jgi:hypothetical protein
MKILAIVLLALASTIVVCQLLWGGVELSPAQGRKQAVYVTAAALVMCGWFWVLG